MRCAMSGSGRTASRIVELDCAGKVVLPGFVDSHTHPAFVVAAAGGFREAGCGSDLRADRGGGGRHSLECGWRAQGREIATGSAGPDRAPRHVFLWHNHRRSQVGIRAFARRGTEIAGSDSGCGGENGRGQWCRRCWALMWSRRNFGPSRKNMLRWFASR